MTRYESFEETIMPPLWHDFISRREEEKKKLALELEEKTQKEAAKKKRARSLFK